MSGVLDLFCGCGGLSLGARAAGFQPKLSIDIDSVLASSYTENHPSAQLLMADVRAVTSQTIVSMIGERPVGIIGGPPCQGFSSIGRRSPKDPRNELLVRFFELVAELRPAFFFVENVPGLLHDRNAEVLSRALSLVWDRYEILPPTVLKASDFGAATTRRRVVVIGTDPDQMPIIDASVFEPLGGNKTTVRTAIGGLPDPSKTMDAARCDDEYGMLLDKLFTPPNPNYRANVPISGFEPTEHSEEVRKRFAATPSGGTDKKSRYPKLDWQTQAPTLRAGTGSERGSYQAARPIHPSEPRVITVREAARLQGFPDWYRFHPTKWHSHRMIGNSVSPIFARELLRRIAETFSVEGKHAA
jgi:DNA (cytosine-5)-methyltransferase 1